MVSQQAQILTSIYDFFLILLVLSNSHLCASTKMLAGWSHLRGQSWVWAMSANQACSMKSEFCGSALWTFMLAVEKDQTQKWGILEEQSSEGFLTKWPVYLGVGDEFVCMSSSSAASLFFIEVGIKTRVGRQVGTCPSVWVSIQFPIMLFTVNFSPFYKVHFTTSPTHVLFDWILNLSF